MSKNSGRVIVAATAEVSLTGLSKHPEVLKAKIRERVEAAVESASKEIGSCTVDVDFSPSKG